MHFVDGMDSCEEMMIQDWPGALYKKDDTAFLCWTYSPEVTYVLEKCDFITENASETGYTTNTKHKEVFL